MNKITQKNIFYFLLLIFFAIILSFILYLILVPSNNENYSPISLLGSVYGARRNLNKCYCNATNDYNFKEPVLMESACCTSCKI